MLPPEPVIVPVAPSEHDTRFFGHPRGLATLFFTEMWERYSYYGTRALLILYMTAGVQTGGLGFSVMKSGALYGFYTAMVYLLSLPAGWKSYRDQARAAASAAAPTGVAPSASAPFAPAIPDVSEDDRPERLH